MSSYNSFFSTGSLSASRGISHTVSPSSKPVVNGDPVEANLAVALGLESEDEDNPVPQPHPPIKKMSSLSPSKQQVGIYLSTALYRRLAGTFESDPSN